MNCRKVSQLISAYLDGELGGIEMLEIREHLAGCQACEMELDQVRQVKRMLSSIPVTEPRVGLEAAIISRARRERELHGIAIPTMPSTGSLAAVLSLSRAITISMVIALLLMASLLWPMKRNTAYEVEAPAIGTYMAEHTMYQNYQPFAGGAPVDMASSDAHARLTGYER